MYSRCAFKHCVLLHYYKILPWSGDRHLVKVFPGAPGYVVSSMFV